MKNNEGLKNINFNEKENQNNKQFKKSERKLIQKRLQWLKSSLNYSSDEENFIFKVKKYRINQWKTSNALRRIRFEVKE